MVQIEKLKEDYLDDVCPIEQVSFKGNEWSKNLFHAALKNKNYFSLVLKLGNIVVGYLISELIKPEATILKLAIHPGHRRKGYAKILLDYFIHELRKEKFEKIFLEVRTQNCPAQNVYGKLGFKGIGIRKKYYPDGEDALVMVYDLKL